MFGRLQALFAANRQSNRRQANRRVRTYRNLAIETLETREVMAAQVIGAVLNAEGVLRVDGTKKADTIVVRQDGGQISVTGVKISTAAGLQAQVAASAVRKIEVFGGNGNDVIRLDQGTQAITVAALLDGGKGHDKYAGGAASDTLVMGAKEKDALLAFGATDQLAFAQAEGIVKSVVRSTDNAVVTLRAGNKLFINGKSTRSGVSDFAMADDGRTVVISTKGVVETQIRNKWIKLETDAVKFSLADDAIYTLGRDGRLGVDGEKLWSNTKDFAVGRDGTLYMLGTSGVLESCRQDGNFTRIAANVETFALNSDGTLSIVYTQASISESGPDSLVLIDDQTLLRHQAAADASIVTWGDWERYGGWFSKIKVGQNLDGRLEEFAIGSDKALWHRWQVAPDGAFSGWVSLGGGIVDIEVARHADGRLIVFAIGTNGGENYIQQTAAGSGSWSSWVSYGGWFSKIKVGQNLDGRLEEFAIGSDKALWHRWQAYPSGWWGAWVKIGGGIVDIEVARNADGRLQVFAIGTDGAENYVVQNAPNDSFGWSGWVRYGGWFRQIKVGQNADGRLEEFAIGSDKALWHRWQVAPNGAWSGWVSLAGGIVDIEVIKNSDGCLQVFAIGTDTAANTIIQAAPNSTNWGSWISLGGGIVELEVAANKSGRLELFVIGTDRAENRKRQLLVPPGPASLVNGTLYVRGTAEAERIVVGQTGSQHHVWINNAHIGSYSGATSVVVLAGDGDDTIDVHTLKNNSVTAYGGRGNDRIYGVYGGAFFGNEGNDCLFGTGASLYGGAGADRILINRLSGMVQFVEKLPDFNSREDAKIYFTNGDRNWTWQEILQIDDGLARLHERTGNTTLLKTAGGRDITFERNAVVEKAQTLAANYGDGMIRVADLTFSTDQTEEPAWATAIHELAHNWDEWNEIGTGFITQFRAISGWVKNPSNTRDMSQDDESERKEWWFASENVNNFVSWYADHSPYEDFAETLTAIFTGDNDRYDPDDAPQKIAFLNDWLNFLG